MTSVRSRAQLPVGSLQWIQDENDQIIQFGIQEVEDFTFSARNEVEWLNEHMTDIFTKSQLYVIAQNLSLECANRAAAMLLKSLRLPES